MTDSTPIVEALKIWLPYLCAALALGGLAMLMLVRRWWRRRPRQIRVGFEDRMADLGLQSTDEGTWEGTIGSRRVRIVRTEDPSSDPPVLIEVSTTVPTGNLRVVIGDAEQTAIRGTRHIGDAEFDPWFEVDGEIEDLAVLSSDLRRTLRNVAKNARPRIEDGWLTLIGPGNIDINARLAPLVAAAMAIEAAAIEPSARVRRFAGDPDAGVRMRALEILSARPASSITALVARDRLDDPEPVVRTLAAVLAKDSARLVTIVQSGDAPPGVRRRAAKALQHTGSEEEQVAAASALATGPTPLHSVAYELCEPLGNVAEAVLITLVGSPNLEVARGAAGQLGKFGSIRAIPALREFQERTGQLAGPLRPELARAIQSMRPKSNVGSSPSAPRARSDQETIIPSRSMSSEGARSSSSSSSSSARGASPRTSPPVKKPTPAPAPQRPPHPREQTLDLGLPIEFDDELDAELEELGFGDRRSEDLPGDPTRPAPVRGGTLPEPRIERRTPAGRKIRKDQR
jgi:hypothetical protein